MSTTGTPSEYLVISRGQWDADATPEQIQAVIDEFYVWIEGKIAEGKMRHGQRLSHLGKTVARNGVVTDGPFGETKEVIGGYWFIIAHSLEEAAQIGSDNPTMRCGLFFEIRPLELARASAFSKATESLTR